MADNEEKISLIASKFEDIFNTIFGNDSWKQNPHFSETPHRLAKMYVNEIFRNITQGKQHENTFDFDFKKYPVSENKLGSDQCEVQVENLTVKAFCAHHLVPFIGTCKVSYKPHKTILGLSKFQRILDELCGVPCVQEELTILYCETLFHLLQPHEVTVEMTCIHTCMISRGVKLENAKTTTKHRIVRKRYD